MKKLLVTSALTGVAMLSSIVASSAQTAITGNLALGYKASSTTSGGATGKIESFRSFTKESQINFRNTGKLPIGADYAAGFSLEFDGNQGGAGYGFATTNDTLASAHGENIYLNIISGKTTFHVGADHIQNPHTLIANIGGGLVTVDEVMSGVNGKAPALIGNPGSAYQAYGVGIIQNFGILRGSVYYAPNRNASQSLNNGGNRGTNDVDGAVNAGADTGESQTEFTLRGDLGVKGLDVLAYYGFANTGNSIFSDKTTGMRVGARYNLGQFSVAGDYAETETGGAATTVVKETRTFGLGYAVNKDLTVAVLQGRTKQNTISGFTEVLTGINIGYALGPISLNAHVARGKDMGLALGTGKAAMVHANVAF